MGRSFKLREDLVWNPKNTSATCFLLAWLDRSKRLDEASTKTTTKDEDGSMVPEVVDQGREP